MKNQTAPGWSDRTRLRRVASRPQIRISVVGTGTVGRWLLRALERLDGQLDVELSVVGLANSGGCVHASGGIDLRSALDVLERDAPLAEVPGCEASPDPIAAMREDRPDLFVDVAKSGRDGEPGLSSIRAALAAGIPVATSDKWPIAVAGVELAALARERGTTLRAESTVMSGTPVLAALTTGIGGAEPQRLRGALNATVNQICTWMDEGVPYERALERAQDAGLAEPDPAEDVDGLDATAKVMILSALVFGEQLAEGDVERRGICSHDSAPGGEGRIREVATIDPRAGRHAVAIERVSAGDLLHDVLGPENAVCLEADPIGRVVVRGPGAGPALAGQGVLSDVLAGAGEIARGRRG